jgi:hypothetical protein
VSNGLGDFPLRSGWLRARNRFSRAHLLRTAAWQDAAVPTIWRDFFFGSGIQVVGWAIGESDDANSITLSLTALRGGIDTAARENDIVIVAHANRSSTDRAVGVATSGYAEVADLYANDVEDMNLSVSWKRMSSTPDTSVTTETPAAGRSVAIAYVLRGVDTTTALDVTSTTATGVGTGVSNPPSITPATEGSAILAVTASMSDSLTTLNGPLNFGYQAWGFNNGGAAAVPHLGIGFLRWQGGTVDPPAPTGHVDNPNVSWCAVTLALRPQQPPAGIEPLTVTSRAIALAGTSVNVRAARRITVNSASIALAGTSVNLRRGFRITANTAAVPLVGTSVNLRAARRITVNTAAATLAGTSVNLRLSRRIAVTSNAVTLTGSSVDLTFTPAAPPKVITVDPGAIVLTGSTVNLTYTPTGIVIPPQPATGGWEWLNSLNPPSRRREEPEEKPEPRRRRLKADTIELAPDLEVITGVIPSMPAWDMMAELQRRQAEAEAARLARLRAIALADDDWLMMA